MSELNADQLLLVTDLEAKKGLVRHHLDSFNDFVDRGIKQIIKDTFVIDKTIINMRNRTEEDKKITKIYVKATITDVKFEPPKTSKFRSGSTEPLLPEKARNWDLNYSSPILVDAKIEATAYYKDHTSRTHTEYSNNFRLASLPTMVGSKYCHTYNKTKEELIRLGEDPQDPGGYFILKGIEWVIDNLENRAFNQLYVFNNKGNKSTQHRNENARVEIVSKPGDGFENSRELIGILLNDGRIVFELSLFRTSKHFIPFYLLFRALKTCSDKEIVENIIYADLDQTRDEDLTHIQRIMAQELDVAFESCYPKFENAYQHNSQEKAVTYLVEALTYYMTEHDTSDNRQNTLRYVSDNLEEALDLRVLPHIGTSRDMREKKIRYLGHMIHTLLLVNLGAIESTDRDSYKDKRVHSAGVSYAKIFKTQYNSAIVKDIKKKLQNDFKDHTFSDMTANNNLRQSFENAIKPQEFEKALIQAITTGNKEIVLNRNKIPNRLSSQQLHRKNQLNVISTMRQINTTNSSATKQSERADKIRRVHSSYVGIVGIAQSADTGDKVGMQKIMAHTCSISPMGSGEVLKKIVFEDAQRGETQFVPLDQVSPSDISYQNMSKVMVNGDWIGCVPDPYPHHGPSDFAWYYRNKRRQGRLSKHTSVYVNPMTKDVQLWIDVGRACWPLLIVENNKDTTNWKQYIKLTTDHIEKILKNEITMDDLIEEGVVEYISPDEHENCYVADSYETFLKHKNDPLHEFTHVCISATILGLPALTCPFASHNQGPRVIFQTNQVKQTCGWPSLSWPRRVDKELFLQYYCETPLVKTVANNYIYPIGQNVYVAVACYGGYNQEDSLIFNQAAIDRGLFNGSMFTFEKTELEKEEEITAPNAIRTKELKTHANYEKLDNDGVVKPGTTIENNDVLIGKVFRTSKGNQEQEYIDKSIVYRREEPAIVEQVIRGQNEDGRTFCKVKLRSIRPSALGDKYCLSEDHQVLTDKGWKYIKCVSTNDKVKTLAQKDGYYQGTTYLPIKEIMAFEREKMMIHIQNEYVDILCTKNHRLFVVNQDIQSNLVDARTLIKHGEPFYLMNENYILLPVNPKTDMREKYYDKPVYCLSVENQIFLTKRENQRGVKAIWSGNSSRAGQKGILGMTYSPADMPTTRNGIVPSIIMNPHALPSRMTVNQLIEGLFGKMCAEKGTTVDGTVFKPINLETITEELEKLGFDKYGCEQLICGFTGEMIDVKIFMTPIYYQRLEKFVADQAYIVGKASTDALLRTPLEGKANRGGVKLGEMEKDVLESAGCQRVVNEKMFVDNSPFKMYVCRNCNHQAVVNKKHKLYQCKYCENNADIAEVDTSYPNKILLQTIEALNIRARPILEPFEYEKM